MEDVMTGSHQSYSKSSEKVIVVHNVLRLASWILVRVALKTVIHCSHLTIWVCHKILIVIFETIYCKDVLEFDAPLFKKLKFFMSQTLEFSISCTWKADHWIKTFCIKPWSFQNLTAACRLWFNESWAPCILVWSHHVFKKISWNELIISEQHDDHM